MRSETEIKKKIDLLYRQSRKEARKGNFEKSMVLFNAIGVLYWTLYERFPTLIRYRRDLNN